MPTGPAARLGDPVAHPIPPMLAGGTGSPNVLIGGRPAWRGLPKSVAAGIVNAKQAADKVVAAAQAATAAAAGSPAYAGAKASEEATKASSAAAMTAAIVAAAGRSDMHSCNVPPIPPPIHGVGVVTDGSATVLVNAMPACRLGDTITEAFGPPNKIVMGQPNVIIGG